MTRLVIILLLNTFFSAYAVDGNLNGRFESVPIDFDARRSDTSNVAKRGIAQVLTIEDSKIVLDTAGTLITMSYVRKEEFLLGTVILGKSELYYPIYIKNLDTLHMMGQKFVRKQSVK